MKVIQQAVIKLGVEEFFVGFRRRINFLRRLVPKTLRHKFTSIGRFVPHSSTYPKDDCYFLTRDNTSFKINRSDYVQWRIFYGVRDNALVYAKQHLTSDSVVLDIGANCGAFSLKLAMYAAKCNYSNLQIHAFEPNLRIVENYKANLALNPDAQNIVHLHPIGFGSETGEKLFNVPEVNSGVGKISNGDGQFKVNIQRLDDFVQKLNPSRIAFIKLIVEGFEPEVFKGGWNTIIKYKPPIFFEATDEWYQENNSSVESVVRSLAEMGYKFMGEYYNEMIPYDEKKFRDKYQYNVFAYGGS